MKKKRRAAPQIQPGRVVIIAREGQETEALYFDDIRRAIHLTVQRIVLLPHRGTDPRTVVSDAVAEKKRRKDDKRWGADDEAWAVYDGDEHFANEANWNDALQLARAHDIRLAITNPAFEFWFLVHFRDHWAEIHRDKAKQELKVHVPDYDKAESIYGQHLAARTTAAIERAKEIAARAERNGLPDYANPCCDGIAKLVESLLNLE